MRILPVVRRTLLLTAAGAAVAAAAVLAVFVISDDDPGVSSGSSTTMANGDGASGAPIPLTTTTVRGAPVQSPGAAPVSGAILSEPAQGDARADVGEETGCAALDDAVTPVACTRADGSGGEFLVYVGRRDDQALQSRLYQAVGPDEFRLTRQSRFFAPDADVAGMSLREERVGGEPVVVVDYDFGGSGAVHSFDVVAWDDGYEEPRVVAFVNGTGGDRVVPTQDGLQFVGANYRDGAPTCCPTQADVRTLTRAGDGEWTITTETVLFADAP